MTFDVVKILAERLKKIARSDVEKYPQYEGYFDGWVLAICNEKTIRYKGGSCLCNGRWVLASPDLLSWFDPDNGNVCGVNSGAKSVLFSKERKMRVVARWQTRGKDFLQLKEENGLYSYTGNGCGGNLPAMSDDNVAIAYMERPWGQFGAGPVTVLKTDRPSLHRTI